MSKSADILFKLIVNQHQSIIKGKKPYKAWKVLQERFQYINPLNTSCLIHEVITKELWGFKDIYKYTNSNQVAFDKVVDYLTKKYYYT